jgi:hypothetical protein
MEGREAVEDKEDEAMHALRNFLFLARLKFNQKTS